MEGLLVFKTGQVQLIGQLDPTDLIEILQDLCVQLQHQRQHNLLQKMKDVATDDLVAELKSRSVVQKND